MLLLCRAQETIAKGRQESWGNNPLGVTEPQVHVIVGTLDLCFDERWHDFKQLQKKN